MAAEEVEHEWEEIEDDDFDDDPFNDTYDPLGDEDEDDEFEYA